MLSVVGYALCTQLTAIRYYHLSICTSSGSSLMPSPSDLPRLQSLAGWEGLARFSWRCSLAPIGSQSCVHSSRMSFLLSSADLLSTEVKPPLILVRINLLNAALLLSLHLSLVSLSVTKPSDGDAGNSSLTTPEALGLNAWCVKLPTSHPCGTCC